jgi:hypothetical protein
MRCITLAAFATLATLMSFVSLAGCEATSSRDGASGVEVAGATAAEVEGVAGVVEIRRVPGRTGPAKPGAPVEWLRMRVDASSVVIHRMDGTRFESGATEVSVELLRAAERVEGKWARGNLTPSSERWYVSYSTEGRAWKVDVTPQLLEHQASFDPSLTQLAMDFEKIEPLVRSLAATAAAEEREGPGPGLSPEEVRALMFGEGE